MHVVIFEVEPTPEGKPRYLEIAGQLRSELEAIDGFLSIERFQSLNDEGRMLSLSYWRDAEAIAVWRANAEHRLAQAEGRRELFAGYRIRIAEVVRDYTMTERDEAPQAPPDETG
jgi:heme-degrading monooxygenase HmoA